MDRNGNRAWPDNESLTSYEPGLLGGGTGDTAVARRPSKRDKYWHKQHFGGVSLEILATADDVKVQKVVEGIRRAIAAEELAAKAVEEHLSDEEINEMAVSEEDVCDYDDYDEDGPVQEECDEAEETCFDDAIGAIEDYGS